MLNHEMEFAIGDWSGDGHSMCDKFRVKVNKTTQEVREIHFEFEANHHNLLSNLCSEYQELEIRDYLIEELVDMGFLSQEDDILVYVNDKDRPKPEEILNLWLALLKFQDSSFEYEVIPPSQINTMHFYGYDEKGRHISQIGYGIYTM